MEQLRVRGRAPTPMAAEAHGIPSRSRRIRTRTGASSQRADPCALCRPLESRSPPTAAVQACVRAGYASLSNMMRLQMEPQEAIWTAVVLDLMSAAVARSHSASLITRDVGEVEGVHRTFFVKVHRPDTGTLMQHADARAVSGHHDSRLLESCLAKAGHPVTTGAGGCWILRLRGGPRLRGR